MDTLLNLTWTHPKWSNDVKGTTVLIPKAPICSLYPRFQEFQSCVSSSWRSGLKQIKTHKNISKNIRIILQISDTLENSRCGVNFHQLKTPKTQRFSSCLTKNGVRIPMCFPGPSCFWHHFLWPKNLGAPTPRRFRWNFSAAPVAWRLPKPRPWRGPAAAFRRFASCYC